MSGKPALSKVAVLERDRQRNCTLVKVFLLFHLISDALYQYMPLALALACHTRIRKQKVNQSEVANHLVFLQNRWRYNLEDHIKSGFILHTSDIHWLVKTSVSFCSATHLELILFCATCAFIALLIVKY